VTVNSFVTEPSLVHLFTVRYCTAVSRNRMHDQAHCHKETTADRILIYHIRSIIDAEDILGRITQGSWKAEYMAGRLCIFAGVYDASQQHELALTFAFLT
jgi:hypothetical protein